MAEGVDDGKDRVQNTNLLDWAVVPGAGYVAAIDGLLRETSSIYEALFEHDNGSAPWT